MKKHEYLVATSRGTCKLSSDHTFDLVSAQKALYDMGENAEIFLIREMNFFEKVLDKIKSKMV